MSTSKTLSSGGKIHICIYYLYGNYIISNLLFLPKDNGNVFLSKYKNYPNVMPDRNLSLGTLFNVLKHPSEMMSKVFCVARATRRWSGPHGHI